MAFGTKDKGRAQEDVLKAQSTAAAAKAEPAIVQAAASSALAAVSGPSQIGLLT